MRLEDVIFRNTLTKVKDGEAETVDVDGNQGAAHHNGVKPIESLLEEYTHI